MKQDLQSEATPLTAQPIRQIGNKVMAYPSVYSSTFQEACKQWLEEQGEVLALFCFSRAAGSRSYEFFTDYLALQERIAQLPPSTCVTVWEDRQLTLRGIVDQVFIARALEQIPDKTDWLLTGLERVVYGKSSWYRNDSGRPLAELEAELPDYMGERIALGVCPPWAEHGGKEVSAIIPNEDGTVTVGVY